MMNWEKYFDAIYCINCITFEKRRKDIQVELERVGITRHKNFMFRDTIISPWNNVFLNWLQQSKLTNMQKPGELSLAFGHYFCIKDALQKKHEKILILEDDIRFLKSLDLIEKILDYSPNDAELIHYDKFPTENTSEQFDNYEKNHKINDMYCSADPGYVLLSTGCYAIYRSGIQKMCNQYETQFLCTDNYAHVANLIRYFPMINLACQVTYNKSMSTAYGRFMWPIHARYKVNRLDYSMYNMPIDNYNFESYVEE